MIQTLWQKFLETERYRFILWVPVLIGVGIALFFQWPYDPHPFAGAVWLCGSVSISLMAWKRAWKLLLTGAVISTLLALGFAAAHYHTSHMRTVLLEEKIHNQEVRGSVAGIIMAEKGTKLLLENVEIASLPQNKTPTHVRISVRKGVQGIQLGDFVRIKATLYPLPEPAMPGGFDFGRYFYFQQIGAVGFSPYTAELLASVELSSWELWIAHTRHNLAEHIRASLSMPEGAIAAALIVGERDAIPEEIKEYMRDAGLAHVLAISGLHLSLVAGIIFFTVRLLLAFIPKAALYFPVKKMAATIALCVSGGYLLLAGMPLSAQRAFIMVAFVLVAVCIDRRGITLYSLAWAAVFILLTQPNALYHAGFQMSFAATLAIVSLYEVYGKILYAPDKSLRTKIWYYFLGIIFTSIAATFATTPFVMMHFNRVPLWGLVANMLVMPLMSFLIMPAAIIAFLLMPFGGEIVGFRLMEYGITWMVSIAAWVDALPMASLLTHSPTEVGFAIAVLGMLWLLLWKSRIRIIGLALLVGGLATSIFHYTPDMLISDDGKQVMVQIDDQWVVAKGGTRGFVVKAWLQSEASESAITPKKLAQPEVLFCEKTHCIWNREGQTILIVKKIYETERLCNQHNPDMVVAWWYIHEPVCRNATVVIDRNDIETGGAHSIFFNESGLVIENAHAENVTRIWMQNKR